MTDSHPPPKTSSTKLSEQERQAIIDRWQATRSIRATAKKEGRSRKLVTKVLKEAGMPIENHGQGKLDEFRAAIQERVEAGLTATRIMREIKELGYTGGRTILNELTSQLRAQQPLQARTKVRRRFETRPGEEMQVDWSLYTVPIADRPTRVHLLGILLAHSRKVYYGAFRNERQETLLEGLARGLEYFQGSALRVVFDNMATAVLGRIGPDRRPLWHPRLLEFARHYGFTPMACAVRDPDRKGKKEKSFRLVYDDFLRGSRFSSWEDLEHRLRLWLDETPGVGNNRRHGTTGLVPNEVWLAERDLLVKLPAQRFLVGREVVRPVDADATIAVAGHRYTVPASLAGHHVPVRLYADRFEVLDPLGNLIFSRRYVDPTTHPGKLVIDPTHYANLPRRPRDQHDQGRLDRDFLRRFPSLEPLVEGLKIRMKAIASIHLRRLLRLADRYGQEAFLAAATTAQQHRRFDAYAVQRMLERDRPLAPEDFSLPEGSGPGILGEVEASAFDEFAHLDEAPDPDQEADDGTP
ncbi:MAG: Mobile element protein [Candidatus Ozemobacter sibiricus]|uniref:Mobile element protein n=1 Tax=Candidatus Ozemobacter sibiricus TaxID=2268124 RepID=A0A367Z9K0_9BACT|nr:MAG: Mobile element protein [Candidatus Ozemobacter sibiricus]